MVYRISEMSNDIGLPRVEYEDINSGQGTLNKDLSGKYSTKQGVLFQADDVLFGKLRPYLKNWLLVDFSGIAVGDFWVLRGFETDSSFIYTLIQSGAFDKVTNQSTGTKMPRADWSLVSNTVFEVPHSKAEQHQIGTFFLHVDNLITLHQRRLCNYHCLSYFRLTQTGISLLIPRPGFLVLE
jgi:type I restriction enzyme S subunit